MLSLISGPFHPTLETAFQKQVKDLKEDDPLSHLAIVAPSTKIKERLEMLLGSSGLTFLNVAFHTFHSLAEKVVHQAGGLPKAVLTDSLFFDTLVKLMVKEDRPFGGFEDLAVPDGFPPQVRGTLRDLMDAGVPYEGGMLTEAIKENFLGRNVDVGWLLQLLHLYQKYGERLESLNVIPSSALLKGASEKAPVSSYLKQFKGIFYYGFYDLTGLQRDFFENIAKNFPVTLFFPHRDQHPDFEFSARFKETVLMPLVSKNLEEEIEENQRSQEVQIFNTSGVHDEAWFIAAEILRLHEKEGMPFHEIAVIARSKERLGSSYPHIFHERSIPFHTPIKSSLSDSPLVETLLRYFSGHHLLSDSSPLPLEASWSAMAEAALQSLKNSKLGEGEEFSKVWDLLLSGIEKMRPFDALSPRVSRKEFLDTLKERWMRSEEEPKEQSSLGVALLYAEAARGLSFRVIFLVGVEERIFPRVIREDPFLRDDARFELMNTLGYKISQKLKGHEEEKLLFHLFISAAQEKLILSYRRTDEEGSVVGPSSFLRAFAKERGIDLVKNVVSIPRSYMGKVKEADPRWLGARDIIFRLLNAGHSDKAVSLAQSLTQDGGTFAGHLEMLAELERIGEPGAYDGCLEKKSWDQLFPHGKASATQVETFGTCPFRFFASSLLKLERLEEGELGVQVLKDQYGSLVHTFFENFYRAYLKDAHLFEDHFNQTFQLVFDSVSAEFMRLHPLYWEIMKIKLKEDLSEFLTGDLREMQESGFQPSYVEECIEAELPEIKKGLTWVAKPDRIDICGNKVRIVDYKTGRIPKNALLSGLRGFKAQPFIYLLLTELFLKKRGTEVVSLSFVYRQLGKDQAQAELSSEKWKANKGALTETLKTQLDLMSQGQFVILPDDNQSDSYCQWCDFETICRRNHGPTQSRSRKGPGQALAALRLKKSAKRNHES